MRRLVVLLVLLCALGAPAAASAQGAFGPLPPATTPSPTPSPEPEGLDQGNVSRGMLLGIAGVVALLFVGIGVYITRDARRNLTAHDRRAVERGEEPKAPTGPEERRKAQQARKKARQKTRAQKQARKKQRR